MPPPNPDADIGAKPWIPPPPKDLVLIHANVVDPLKESVLQDMTLHIKSGLVKSLEKTTDKDDLRGSVDEGQVVDAKGLWICPGLIDCHTHTLAVPGSATMAGTWDTSRDTKMLRVGHVLKGMLSRGFTTVRDVGGANKALATAIEEWLIPGPRMFQGGPVVSQTGGHADIDNPGSSGLCCGGAHDTSLSGEMGRVVDGVENCLYAARDLMRQGADHIKICTSGGVGSITDKLEATQFTVPEIQAITTTVRNMGGRLVTAHCYTSEGTRHSIEGGVGGIEHGNLLDTPTAKLMSQKGIFLTPTLAVHTIISSPPYRKFLQPSQLEKNEIVREKGMDAIQIAEKNGVTVCYGTDMLGSMHQFQTNEFVTRAKVLPSKTVLKHATVNAAKLLGQEGKLGRLVPGAFADLIVLKENPLEDVTILDRFDDNLLGVVKEGRVVVSQVDGLEVDDDVGYPVKRVKKAIRPRHEEPWLLI